jgi:23S rRNA (uracil1939-C5)-methyltransferase
MSPSPSRAPAQTHELELHGLTHTGEAVGRLPDGKACFVAGAIPGERVLVEVTEQHKRWARARLVEVRQASPDRVEPPCPYYGTPEPGGPPRCGGCALQHVAPARQAEMKRRIVTEQLERIGRFTGPPVAETLVPATQGYREQARFAVTPDGRLGFRGRGGHDVVAIDRCLLLTGETQRLREWAGDAWAGVDEVTVRSGQPDGDLPGGSAGVLPGGSALGVLIISPGPAAIPPVPDGDVGVALSSARGTLALRGETTVTKRVGEATYRVSAGSFFQSGTLGAAVLVDLVRAAAAIQPGDTVLDLYAGVGLFARALAADGAHVTAVEADPSAADDARLNLVEYDADVRTGPAEAAVAEMAAAHRWFDVVVLDPPRRGAGAATTARLAELEPRTVVYVACEVAALARDARALVDAGLTLVEVTPVDLFAHTAAIEAVAVFTRGT